MLQTLPPPLHTTQLAQWSGRVPVAPRRRSRYACVNPKSSTCAECVGCTSAVFAKYLRRSSLPGRRAKAVAVISCNYLSRSLTTQLTVFTGSAWSLLTVLTPPPRLELNSTVSTLLHREFRRPISFHRLQYTEYLSKHERSFMPQLVTGTEPLLTSNDFTTVFCFTDHTPTWAYFIPLCSVVLSSLETTLVTFVKFFYWNCHYLHLFFETFTYYAAFLR